MGINVEPHVNDYWNTSEEDGPIHQPVEKTMSIHRWKQIDRYLHIWDPALDRLFERPDDKVRPHEKVNPLWKLLSSSFQRYWKPGRDHAIDGYIEGFTGRTRDILNIPTKPTPIGFKIWILADSGYVLDLLWHVEGDGQDQGPQGLRTTWEEPLWNYLFQTTICNAALIWMGQGHSTKKKGSFVRSLPPN